MQIVPFSTDDIDELNYWLKRREFPLWDVETLPSWGYKAQKSDQIIAVGFLRFCEGNIGMMDSFATNPHALSHDRHEGLNLLINYLIDKAKDECLKSIFFFTKEQCIIDRTHDFGFKEFPAKILCRDL